MTGIDPNSEAYHIIAELLVTIRRIIHRGLLRASGDTWYLDGCPEGMFERLVERKEYAKAFEAFKKPFLANLSPADERNGGEGTSIYCFYSWKNQPDTRAELRARDLRNKVYGDRDDLVVKRFVPAKLG